MELPYNVEAEKQVLANMIFSSDMLVQNFPKNIYSFVNMLLKGAN